MNDLPTRDSATFADRTQADDVQLLLAAIVDSSDDAIVSETLNGVILTWNRAAQRLFGYSEEEAVGQPITINIPPELHHEDADILRRLQAGEPIEHYETRRLTRDKRILDVSLTVSPVRVAGGTIVAASKILRDVTESKQAQAALRESRQRLEREAASARTLQSISTRMISELQQESLFALIVDAAMELMVADAASIQMLAPDEQSLILLGWRNFHPDSAAHWQRVTADAESTCGMAVRAGKRVLVPDVESCEFMVGTKDLQAYRLSGIRAAQSTLLRSRVGRPLGMLSTHWRAPHTPTEDDFRSFDVLARQAADLIERTRAESAARESEERFRLVANSAPVMIWMSGPDRGCNYANRRCIEFTGQSEEALLGNGWAERVHPDDRQKSMDAYIRAFDSRQPFAVDYRLRRCDGEYRWVVDSGVPRFAHDGSFAGYIGSAIDISERKQAEETLATVSQRLIDAQDKERRRIARELHDDINQRLALLAIELEQLQNTPSEFHSRVQQLGKRLTEISNDVQSLSHELHSSKLDYLGVAPAIKSFCSEFAEKHGVSIDFKEENMPKHLPKEVALCLFRVAQEALHNALKYSGVRHFAVEVSSTPERVQLVVRDAGAGFAVEEAKNHGGLGLVSMQERINMLRGQFSVESQPGEGTKIVASVPVIAEDEGSSAGWKKAEAHSAGLI